MSQSTGFEIDWIRSHQDDHGRKEDLTPESQINIEMDQEATEERKHGRIVNDRPYPGSGAMLIIDGEWITTKYAERIQDASNREAHLAYFLEKYGTKFGFTREHYDSIWNTIGRAHNGLNDEDNKRV